MKPALVAAIGAASISLPLSVLQSATATGTPDFGESVTKLSASNSSHGGGGGHGGSSAGGGHASGAAAHSTGPRGYSAGYRPSFRGATAGVYPGMGAGRYPIYGAPISNRIELSPHHVSSVRGTITHRVTANQTRMSRPSRLSATRQTPVARNTHRLTTRDGQIRSGNLSRNNPKNKARFGPQTQQKLRNWQGRTSDLNEARQRNNDCHNHHHNHDWWHRHCDTIIFVDWGWWGWWDGWWYPAWGYDPFYSSYPYDGPIYGYSGLPPDEVVANVQSELQRLGYYSYAVDGVLGPQTQNALNRYQRDHRLPITGTIDPATIGSLGL